MSAFVLLFLPHGDIGWYSNCDCGMTCSMPDNLSYRKRLLTLLWNCHVGKSVRFSGLVRPAWIDSCMLIKDFIYTNVFQTENS